MRDRSSEPTANRRSVENRRRFLRNAATLTVLGSIPGCVELVDVDETDDGQTDDDETDASPAPDDASTDEREVAFERAIHDRVSDVRRDHDRRSLAYNEDIAAVARRHSADMDEGGYFTHESPEGERPADRLEEFMPEPCRMIGENIANVGLRPDDDPEAVAERVISGWMDSEGHRENLLRETFDEEGIGVRIGDADRVLVTQNLCATRM